MNIVETALPAKGHNRPRNPGVPLDPSVFESVGVNASAVERRAATLTTRRSVKKEWQAAWLVKAMTCIDLTTLAGDDTPERVRRLCAKAKKPLSDDLIEALGLTDSPPTVGDNKKAIQGAKRQAGTVKKSNAAITSRWLLRKASQRLALPSSG